MITKHRLVSVSIAAVLALSVTPLLTACNPGQMVTDAAQKAVKDATGVDVNVDGGGNTLPSNWPAEVPIISGKVSGAGSVSANGGTTWTAGVEVSDLKSGFDQAKSKLTGAGFAVESENELEGNYLANFTKGNYSVILTAADAAGTKTVTYVVGTTK